MGQRLPVLKPVSPVAEGARTPATSCCVLVDSGRRPRRSSSPQYRVAAKVPAAPRVSRYVAPAGGLKQDLGVQCHDVKDAVHPPRYRLLVDVVSADALSKAFKEGRQFLTAEFACALV